MKSLLVTGGAGYIGSHTVRQLVAQGYQITVLDNLAYGHEDAVVDQQVDLVKGSVGDSELVDRLFSEKKFDAVIHFAAYTYVGESVTDPLKYYNNNTSEPIKLLQIMQKHQCRRFVFSSTCATYGEPQQLPLVESHPQAPINPYGMSKLMVEQVLQDCDHAWGLKSAALRYFNASGCSDDGVIGEDHEPETHLIPRVLMAITGEIDKISVFGTDYDTADGTCIRDYIHVNDLASAHIKALDFLERENESIQCNIGTGIGVSVQEIIDAAEKVTGKKVPLEYGPRREGDPSKLIAQPDFAKEKLGWEASYLDAESIVRTAWTWMNGPRKGRYDK